jgi:hypothetical protein
MNFTLDILNEVNVEKTIDLESMGSHINKNKNIKSTGQNVNLKKLQTAKSNNDFLDFGIPLE